MPNRNNHLASIAELLAQHEKELLIGRSRSSLSTVVDEETVLLHTDTGRYNCLDPVGSAVWRHLQEPISYAHLLGNLLGEYDVTEAECSSDLNTLLEQLRREHLIELVILPQQGTAATGRQLNGKNATG
ncbi:MAG: PqqD family protein [Desulfofustis sp.]|nr:PqqD family protein [Desulfofustis sp.]